jgi:hypothetical protein
MYLNNSSAPGNGGSGACFSEFNAIGIKELSKVVEVDCDNAL